MESLFRFQLIRPPVAPDSTTVPSAIPLSQSSTFQKNVADQVSRASSSGLRDSLAQLANIFISPASGTGNTDTSFVNVNPPSPFAAKVLAFAAQLNAVAASNSLTVQDVASTSQAAFGAVPSAVVGNTDATALAKNLKDSILAVKLQQSAHGKPIDTLATLLRHLDLLQVVANIPSNSTKTPDLDKVRARGLQLPDLGPMKSIFANATSSIPTDDLENQKKKTLEQAKTALQEFGNTKQAIEELTGLNNHEVQINVVNDQSIPSGGDPNAPPTLRAPVRAADSPNQGLGLSQKGLDKLSQATKDFLGSKTIDPSKDTLPDILKKLNDNREQSRETLLNIAPAYTKTTIKNIGDKFVVVKEAQPSAVSDVVYGNRRWGEILDALPPNLVEPVKYPAPKRGVAAAGISDLLVVKQTLKGYEGADVGHVENILKGESKIHENTNTRKSEQSIFSESETTSAEERELESTSRFEMSRETDTTLKEDESLKAGLQISASYGPFVQVAAQVEGSMSSSKQEQVKTASKYSQDVTERSSKKITDRILKRSTTTTTNEIIDRNAHNLDNSKGTTNISGVYQWVNKIYEAQIFNYGRRTMYDFMVPEPATWMIETLSQTAAQLITVEKPIDFPLQSSEITVDNYREYASRYQATDINPPPEQYKVKTATFGATGLQKEQNIQAQGEIQMDEGYEAVGEASSLLVVTQTRDSGYVYLSIGANTVHFWNHENYGDIHRGSTFTQNVDHHNSIPYSVIGAGLTSFSGTIQVISQVTHRSINQWKIDTHGKIVNAYKARLQEYEEKLSAIKLQSGVSITGKNPTANMKTIKDELKKHCLSILTEQDQFYFNSMKSVWGITSIDFDRTRAEGAYVRFFEQAFEWEQMMWITYPYFWGRYAQWDDRLSYNDVDPLFDDFLKAGYARVLVPARPTFEGALDHFRIFGEIWNGGPLPTVSDPQYLPIADELAEKSGKPGSEVPVGEAWEVRVPTTLVKLRGDDQLPKWQKDGGGKWVPAI